MTYETSSARPSAGLAPLAGLVSIEAEHLYARLNASDSLPIGTGPGEIDIESAAARELVDAELLFADPADANRVQSVSISIALTLLLSRRQHELMEHHERAIRGWSALESQLRADRESLGSQQETDSRIEIVRDRLTMVSLSADLYKSARRELCTTTTGKYTTPLGEHQLLTPPKSSLTNGARFRNIYDGAFASSPAGARIIELSRLGGEEARVRATLPTKMLLVDQRIAMIAFNDTGVGAAAVVRSPQLLTLLHEWFDLVWDDPSTSSAGSPDDGPLNQPQRHVLRLLATGLSDDAIARRSEMSVRTVRRHITSIMEILGTSTRFATGVAATKRGWI